MRYLFNDCDDPSKVARMQLSKLHDGNYLKPVVWAESTNNGKKYFAVSVGMRPYLRPLYLFTKLRSLGYINNNTVALERVEAFQTIMHRKTREGYNPSKKSGYKANNSKDEGKRVEKETKLPCASCEIFFQGTRLPYDRNTKFPYFGNCAEFDIVKEENSEAKLNEIKSNDPWRNFENGCQEHFEAFTILKEKMPEQREGQLERNDVLDYYNNTHNINRKALKYKWFDSAYELATIEEY